ncbi:hypothetical protein B0H12DRAFT_1103623 [Mycena haematopus]|nr:hypothetical protein B0H12DRAFT_1103623 [Mycena haematopus]
MSIRDGAAEILSLRACITRQEFEKSEHRAATFFVSNSLMNHTQIPTHAELLKFAPPDMSDP